MIEPGKQKLQPFRLFFLTSKKDKINMGVNGSVDGLRICAAILNHVGETFSSNVKIFVSFMIEKKLVAKQF